MSMFLDFHFGKLDIYRLNFSMLSLIPKEADAKEIRKFRPTSLLSCIFKLFTKVITNRLGSLMHRLISLNQSTFIKGRYILESVVTTHEVLHSVHCSKDKGVILKLGYEKTFDMVKLDFLIEMLERRGFSQKFINVIKSAT
jgi:mannosylglycoprotein endo-beta-mannosidase